MPNPLTPAIDLGPRLGEDPLDVLKHALSFKPLGLRLEFGVASGRSLRLIADGHPAWGFDSFAGLPEDWRPGFHAGTFACVPPDIPDAFLVVGFIEDTLPRWCAATPVAPIGLIHIDTDLYCSAATVLEHLGRHLDTGSIVVFDEFHGYPGCEHHEQLAWSEFVDATGIEYDVLGHGPEQWAVRIR